MTKKYRYKIIIEYDGSGFYGWQRQNDLLSVQECLENALFKFCQQKIEITGSGRTDSGVHALGQVAHFDFCEALDPFEIMSALNFHVRPNKVVVLDCTEVAGDFHSRFSAKQRSYIYKIINRRPPLALDDKRSWHIPIKLDVEAMKEAAKFLLGTHDFSSFRDSKCQAKSPIRTIDKLTVTQENKQILINISAPSFLHHMVRNICGTLQLIGTGKYKPEYIKEILVAKDRCRAGPTAPPQGLYLVEVVF